MTDRYKGLVVTLKQDTRSDDAEALIQAIGLLQGVASVSGSVVKVDDYMNRERVRLELVAKLWAVLNPTLQPE